MNTVHLVAHLVANWKAKAAGLPTLAFAVDRAHAQSITRAFLDAGVTAECIDMLTSREERNAIFTRFQNKELAVIVSVNTLIAGADLDVRCIVYGRPTKSIILYVQFTGRGMRTADGKDHLLILDHAGVINEHGFVTDIVIDQLDDGTRRRSPVTKIKTTWTCCECHAVMPKTKVLCTECGAKSPGQAVIVEHDVELQEITAPVLTVNTPNFPQLAPLPQRISQTVLPKHPLPFYRQLRGFAALRGYSPRWCDFSFRDHFGAWPTKFKSASPATPTPAIAAWAENRTRAFVQRQRQLEKYETQAAP